MRRRSRLRSFVGHLENLEPRQLLAGDLVGSIVINEIMTANVESLQTRVRTSPGGRFRGAETSPDWIEIRNLTDESVDLRGASLTDNPLLPAKWTFGEGTMIPPNDYLVVFASGMDIKDPELDENGLQHTSFKLDSKGEFLALFDADATLVDSLAPEYPQQYADISYGRSGGGQYGYSTATTPGLANAPFYVGKVDDTSFSRDRGFYSEAFDVEITTDTVGATIRYTLDGTEPTADSGSIYDGPITIVTTSHLRAAAFKIGLIPSDVDTQTYVFLNDVIRQPAEIPGFPIGGRTWAGQNTYVPQDSEMDPEVVNDPAYSDEIIQSLLSIPTMAITSDPGAIFDNSGWYDGEDVEHGVSVEVIYPDDPNSSHQVNAGIESHSHDRLKRSLRLNFREDYGDDSFNTDLIRRNPLFGEGAANRFDTMVLRGGNNRSWARIWNPSRTAYTIDEFYRTSQVAMSGYGMRGNFVHLYLNGVYWGLYNPVERADPLFSSTYFGGETKDWFTVHHGGDLQGDDERWDQLNRMARDDMSVAENYEKLREYLEVDDYIDYLIISWWTAVSDWPQNNFYATNRNDTTTLGPSPARYLAWDGEWSWGEGGQSSGNGKAHVHQDFRSSRSGGPPIARLWHAARANDDFMTTFADRVYKHLFNNGALTEENAKDRWHALNDYVRSAVVAESARWGDSLEAARQPTRTRDEDWQNQVDRVDRLMTGNNETFLRALRREEFYPNDDPPAFDHAGGRVEAGFELAVTNLNDEGTIYLTLDGSDPRMSGGDISPTAQAVVSGQSVRLEGDVQVRARLLRDGDWSAINETSFLVDSSQPIVISEVMYNPPNPSATELAGGFTDNDDFEFIELHNRSNQPQNLAGMRFDGGIRFDIPEATLAPNQYAVVVANENAFRMRYGNDVLVLGHFDRGGLSNGGERIELLNALDEPIADFKYGDGWNWPLEADGAGASLEVIHALSIDLSTLNQPVNWRSSSEFGGTPGRPASGKLPVIVNEVLASDVAPGAVDAIEILNVSGQLVDISGLYLSDDNDNLSKFRIPDGTTVPGNGFVVFTANQFNPTPDVPGPNHFGLSGTRGDEVYLTRSADGTATEFVDAVEFPASRPSESMGRIDRRMTTLFPMADNTLGRENTGPRIPDVVISELNHQPGPILDEALQLYPNLTNDDLEFIELTNSSNETIDLNQWRIQGGVEYLFDGEAELAAGESLIVVPFNPDGADNASRLAVFRRQFNLGGETKIVGGYSGQLSDRGERIRLAPNGAPPVGAQDVPYLFESEVHYDAALPWPEVGENSSLNLTSASRWGNDAGSWRAAAPSPGIAQFTSTDLNGDGTVNAADIDHLCGLIRQLDPAGDLNGDQQIDATDSAYFVNNLLGTQFGDANFDRIFNSSDLVQVFQAGEYEDDVDHNSTWAEGDWDCDQDFTTSDMVLAFQSGGYSPNAKHAADAQPESARAALDSRALSDAIKQQRERILPPHLVSADQRSVAHPNWPAVESIFATETPDFDASERDVDERLLSEFLGDHEKEGGDWAEQD